MVGNAINNISVISLAAVHAIASQPAVEPIIAASANQDILATKAINYLGPSIALKRVVILGAGDLLQTNGHAQILWSSLLQPSQQCGVWQLPERRT